MKQGLIGVFVSYVMGNFAIQLYTLAFKAELTTLAMLQTVIMVWDTLNEPLIGMMQARPPRPSTHVHTAVRNVECVIA